MPYLTLDDAQLFYDDMGEGPTILTTHGVGENGSYWGRTGVSQALVDAGYRVIDTDMRGHGRSVPVAGQAPGFNVDTIAADFGRIADHLGVDRFHLLTHATGGMAGLHYAMYHSDRLLSLMSTDTGSATAPSDEYCAPEYDDHVYEKAMLPFGDELAAPYETMTLAQLMSAARAGDGEPFLNRFNVNSDPDRCWNWAGEIIGASNPSLYTVFMRSFYDNPDPKVSLLKTISCPNLVLLGEYDTLFIKPSELLARCIPDVKHVVMGGIGHMTAIEAPDRFIAEILSYLSGLDRAA